MLDHFLACLEPCARKWGWRADRDPPPLLWLLYSEPAVLQRWLRTVPYRDELITAWRSCWWHETKAHIVAQVFITIGSSLGATIISRQLWGRALFAGVAVGVGAMFALVVGHGIRSTFIVRRLTMAVNQRVHNRFDSLLRMRGYFAQANIDPNINQVMYEQRHHQALSFASEVDRFLQRYFPNERIDLSQRLFNVRMPLFQDVAARTQHIDTLDSIIHAGLVNLEGLRCSGKKPKPIPFNQVG